MKVIEQKENEGDFDSTGNRLGMIRDVLSSNLD